MPRACCMCGVVVGVLLLSTGSYYIVASEANLAREKIQYTRQRVATAEVIRIGLFFTSYQ